MILCFTAYNRLGCLKKMLKSLKSNQLEDIEICISVDYSDKQQEIVELLNNELKNTKKIIFQQNEKLGVRQNPYFLLDFCFSKNDTVIYLEDDLEVSNDIIQLAKWYESINDDSVCLHLFNYNATGNPESITRTHKFDSALGLVIKKDKWLTSFKPFWFDNSYSTDGAKIGWDWAINNYITANNLYSLMCSYSRTTHIGHVGTHSLEDWSKATFGHIKPYTLTNNLVLSYYIQK